jgi:hypothetical protein
MRDRYPNFLTKESNNIKENTMTEDTQEKSADTAQLVKEILIKRVVSETDTRTKITLPRIPQENDILILHEEHSDIVSEYESETIELKVLSIRTRFDLRNPDNPQTVIVTEIH